MYFAESFDFRWLIPILMIGFCFSMCFFRVRGWAMGGCCGGWRSSRGATNPRSPDREAPAPSSHAATPSGRKAEAETLKLTFDRLERRLRNLEDAVTSKEFDWARRFNQS